MSYYILDEQQYYVLMNMAMGRSAHTITKASIDISKAEVCGKPIKKAELHPYCVMFNETEDPDTGETIITGRAAVSAKSIIRQELMFDHPEMARQIAKEKICKSMANEMIEQLTWRFV